MVMGLVVGIGQSILDRTAQDFKEQDQQDHSRYRRRVVLLAVTKALPAMFNPSWLAHRSAATPPCPLPLVQWPGQERQPLARWPVAVAVVDAAYKGGGSAGQIAGRAMGAVAGAAFDRLAGMPGSRMGSVMGNAASGLRQQNQQRQLQLNQPRSLTAPGSSGGGSPSSSAAQRASAAFASQALQALLPAGAVRRRQGVVVAVLAPQSRDPVPPPGVGHVPPPPQVVGVLCRRPHKLGQAMPRPRDSPRRLPLHPNPEARPHSPPQAGPRELLLSAARRRLRPVVVHLLSLQAPTRPSARRSRPVTVPELPLRPSLPFQPRTPRGRQPKACLQTRPTQHLPMLPPGPSLQRAARRSRPPLEPHPVTRWIIVRPGPPQPPTSLPVRWRLRRSRARLSLLVPPRLHGPPPTFIACR